MDYDFCIIGGGIVGLATAWDILQRRPGSSLIVLEKEDRLGSHQTGHNSGVIHSGIYYAPGSLKARLCKEGATQTKEFCEENGIAFETCGKLLVATDRAEEERMLALLERSHHNGVAAARLGSGELKALEPNIEGVGALLVPVTGIVDYKQVCDALARRIQQAGGEIALGTKVSALKEHGAFVEVDLGDRVIKAGHITACAGLQGDRLARAAGMEVDCRIVPFRGEYFKLPESKSSIIRHLIYPIPDPELPFLGIHLTRMIDGSVTVGPNAVFGFAREGYPHFSFDFRDTFESLTYRGTWKVLGQHWRSAAAELRSSLWKQSYLKQCRKYCPSLELEDLGSYPAGIRAQAVLRDGTLVHDFLFAASSRMVHVLNAPSPAATSALPIGRVIADTILDEGSGRI